MSFAAVIAIPLITMIAIRSSADDVTYYNISSYQDLVDNKSHYSDPNAYFRLTQDITLNGTDMRADFSATFDGQGHTIYNCQGAFLYLINSATFKNVTISNKTESNGSEFTATNSVFGSIGTGDPLGTVTVENVTVTRTVSNNGTSVGILFNGLWQDEDGGKVVIRDCSCTGTVTNTHENELTETTVVKVWDDADNRDGNRPASVTMKLYANNGDTFSFSRTHNNNGDVSFFAGIVGAAEGYSIVPNAPQSVYDWPHGKEISVHEDRTLSVTYNANGGKNAPAATYFYGSTENIKLASATPTRTGYTFSGWNTNSGGTGTSYSAGQNIGTRTSSLTLYAKWTPNTYVISYDANGGSNAPASQTTTYGTPLTLTTAVPTWAGHTFLGWANSSEATSARYQPGGTYTLNSTRTLYAVWKLDEYSLTTSISQTGITVNILRTSSPVGGAAQGLLYNGDKLYLNDVVKISWSIASGYTADTLEINGEDVRSLSQKTITVTRDMTVTMLVGSGAVVYIGNQPYQVFIGNGTSWVQYQAYIGNGTTWDAY